MERTRNKKALKDAKKEFKKGKLPLEADRILMAESDYGEEHPLGLAIKRGITKNKPYSIKGLDHQIGVPEPANWITKPMKRKGKKLSSAELDVEVGKKLQTM